MISSIADNESYPLFCTAVAVGLLVFFIAKLKLHAFLALLVASIIVGLGCGMPLADLSRGFQEGMGATLGFVAPVVGLGTILGKMLGESGGAVVIARTFISWMGREQLHWTMMFVALVVGISVFFAVGLVLLIPIVFTLAKETGKPLLLLGLPLIAGLAISHNLIPPHPGPMLAIQTLKADTGLTLFYSLLAGLPAAIIGGPLYGRWISRRIIVPVQGLGAELAATQPGPLPMSAITAFVTILAPLLLMMLATLADLALPAGGLVRVWADFLGSPIIAMFLAVLLAFYTFGAARGFNRKQILAFSESCLAPAASIFLVVGAGGGFSKVLDYAGVDDAIARLIGRMAVSPLLLGWIVAALIRVAVGSATVSIAMSAAIVAPVAALAPSTSRELLVLAMGSGSLILSHVNDGGFWFVKEYFNMTVGQTLRTWTVMVTVMSVISLGTVLLLDQLRHLISP